MSNESQDGIVLFERTHEITIRSARGTSPSKSFSVVADSLTCGQLADTIKLLIEQHGKEIRIGKAKRTKGDSV